MAKQKHQAFDNWAKASGAMESRIRKPGSQEQANAIRQAQANATRQAQAAAAASAQQVDQRMRKASGSGKPPPTTVPTVSAKPPPQAQAAGIPPKPAPKRRPSTRRHETGY